MAKISIIGNSAVSFNGTLYYPVHGKEYFIKDTYDNYLKALEYTGEGKINITESFTQTVDSVARKIKKGTVQLNGLGTTRVSFKEDLVASVIGTESGPFDLSSGDKTLKVTPDGESQETIIFTAVAGYHQGDNTGTGDISSGTDNKFKIAVDEDVDAGIFHEIELDLTNCTSGADTASEIETQINEIEGYQNITVSFTGNGTGVYKITSGTKGTGSKVRIQAADDNNVTEELAIGPHSGDGGGDVDGGGCAINAKKASVAEIVAFINEEATNFSAISSEEGTVALLGKTAGISGILVIDNSSTATTILGISDGSYGGVQGLKFGVGMLPGYVVNPVLVNSTTLTETDLGISNKTRDEFSIDCEKAASEDLVDLIISGEEASL